jgi:hypothetical protein
MYTEDELPFLALGLGHRGICASKQHTPFLLSINWYIDGYDRTALYVGRGRV